MAAVSGDVSTWGITSFPADSRLVVWFVPSTAAVGPTEVLPRKNESVEPAADGSFTKNLIPTTGLTPKVWYTVRFEWFQKHPVTGAWELDGWSDLPGKLRVPPEGGDISALFDTSEEETHVRLYFGYGPPPSWLPAGGVYYDVGSTEGVDVYADAEVV